MMKILSPFYKQSATLYIYIYIYIYIDTHITTRVAFFLHTLNYLAKKKKKTLK